MYSPIQLPYLLNTTLSQHMRYTETCPDKDRDFIICFWEMQPLTEAQWSQEMIIAADGCIDLVANYDEKVIGFSGMSRTDFSFRIRIPSHYIGARMMPGAFHLLTGLPASAAMDAFLPLAEVWADFDQVLMFSLAFDEACHYFREYLHAKIGNRMPDQFLTLFNRLSIHTAVTAKELYEMLSFSPRQCQRLFARHYGISPKMVLSIIRFHKCLEILTSPEAASVDILSATDYYDQPHFIRDFKRNLGITPMELIRKYQS